MAGSDGIDPTVDTCQGWLLRRAVFPIQDAFLKAPRLTLLKSFLRLQWASREELLEYQMARLRPLLRHAYQNTRFYRERFKAAGVRPDDIRSVSDLRHLPPVSRDDLRDNLPLLASRDLRALHCKVNTTGGTTGQPLQYHTTWEAWAADWAALYRTWIWAGHRIGKSIVTIGGRSLAARQSSALIGRLRSRLEQNYAIELPRFGPDSLELVMQLIRRRRPLILRGYPSMLTLFADACREADTRVTGLRSIITTGEMLLPQYRSTLQSLFGVSVWDGYGCRDGGAIAAQCSPTSGYHWAAERAILEIEPDEQGGSTDGELLSTDLWNYATPFIRYRVGDRVRLASEICGCGRQLPLIQAITGRTGDILRFPGGIALTPPAITLLFREATVLQYMLVQESENLLAVRYVEPRQTRSGMPIEAVLEKLRRYLGGGVQVVGVKVAALDNSESGKHKIMRRAFGDKK